MARVGIDTNVLVRYITRDVISQSEKAEAFLTKHCIPQNPGFISILVCCELDWVLRKIYKYSRDQMYQVYQIILSSDDLEVEDALLLSSILKDFANSGADLADLVILKKANQHGCQVTYTFDKKAAKVEGFQLIH